MLSAYRNIKSLSDRLDGQDKTTASGKDSYGDLDKRSSPNAFQTLALVADTLKDIADTTANALGIRSPYYIIGEVPKEGNQQVRRGWSNYDKAAYGVYRAVSNVINWSNEQEGVIIDSLGDMSATISVEFTSKPLFYLTENAIDSRMRKPVMLKSTIAISNYLSDNAVGAAANLLAAYDPTGTLDLARDELLYAGNTRAQYALYRLRWLMENGIPFTVYTPHGYYENMLIESLNPRTDANNLDMLLCDITYKEAILAAPYSTTGDFTTKTPVKTQAVVATKQTKSFADLFTI